MRKGRWSCRSNVSPEQAKRKELDAIQARRPPPPRAAPGGPPGMGGARPSAAGRAAASWRPTSGRFSAAAALIAPTFHEEVGRRGRRSATASLVSRRARAQRLAL
jgi:hypothetical protein